MEKGPENIQIRRLGDNPDFYNNVFKRIESITSAVFYVLSYSNDKNAYLPINKTLSDKVQLLHEMSIKVLSLYSFKDNLMYELQQQLLSLSSSLQIAVAARQLPSDIVRAITEHIDSVQRYCANRTDTEIGLTLKLGTESSKREASTPKKSQPQRRVRRTTIPTNDISSDAYMVHSQLTDRAERIKTVLEAKPQATIKDIAQIVTDVSEKTIQRELNSLIDEGQVVREGERRWSKYSVVK
jgi:hypothetical protein